VSGKGFARLSGPNFSMVRVSIYAVSKSDDESLYGVYVLYVWKKNQKSGAVDFKLENNTDHSENASQTRQAGRWGWDAHGISKEAMPRVCRPLQQVSTQSHGDSRRVHCVAIDMRVNFRGPPMAVQVQGLEQSFAQCPNR